MADTFTTSNPKAKVVQFVVDINGPLPTIYTVESIKTKREIGSIPTATITIKEAKGRAEQDFSAGPSAFPGAIGDPVFIEVGTVSSKKVIFAGEVDDIGISISKTGATFDVSCKDLAEGLTRKKRNEFKETDHVDVTDDDIMNLINGRNEANVAVLSDMSILHEHMPLVDSSDWDFLMMRAEYYGHMVTCMDGKIEIEEPRLDSQATYTFGIDISDINLNISSKGQVEKVEAKAWDPDEQTTVDAVSSEPGFALHGAAVRGLKVAQDSYRGSDDNVLKLNHMGKIEKGDLKKWVDGTLKRLRLGVVTGTITVDGNYDLRPNRAITLAGCGKDIDGLAFVKGVEHNIVPFNWDTTLTLGYEVESFAQQNSGGSVSHPAATGHTPPANSGKQIAKVKQIFKDPKKGFRVQVDVKNMGDEDQHIWARVAAPQGSAGTGFYNMPEVGDEVTISFLNGDPRFPIIDGSIYSKKNNMPVDPDGGGDWDGQEGKNNVKGFFSREGLMMRFQEVDKIWRCETPAGNVMEMNEKEKHILIEDQNKNKILMNEKGIEVYTPFDLKVKADKNIEMEAGMTIKVKSGTSSKYEAGTSFDTKAGTANTMKGVTCEVNGSATVTVKGGIVQIN